MRYKLYKQFSSMTTKKRYQFQKKIYTEEEI